MKCADCGETAKTYYDKEFYDVDEPGWVTDCGTGGCGFSAAKTRKQSREKFKMNAPKAHVLLTKDSCRCNKRSDYPCPVCDGGLAVCSICGRAEAELDLACWRTNAQTSEEAQANVAVTESDS